MKTFNDVEFIKLNRKILNWQWYSDPCTRDVFIHCLLEANWCDGEWHGYKYKRGQFITSLPSLSAAVGFSIKNVRTALNHLKSTGELADWYDNKVRIITVINYDKYQTGGRRSGSPRAGNRQATGMPGASDKEYKEYKEIKEESATTTGVETPSSAPREKSIYERMRE